MRGIHLRDVQSEHIFRVTQDGDNVICSDVIPALCHLPLRSPALPLNPWRSSPTKEMVNAVVQSSERLEGAASLLAMLEDKADSEQITASELSAVRCIVEACASDLDVILERA